MVKRIKKRKQLKQMLGVIILTILFGLSGFALYDVSSLSNPPDTATRQGSDGSQNLNPTVTEVIDVLRKLDIKDRAPKTGYEREQFTSGWAEIDGCDMRNVILQRDLKNIVLDKDKCTVLSGTLVGPYTAKQITFQYGVGTSSEVQIDHVVALGDAWQKGAQELDVSERVEFSNDPLNLLAVDGPTNGSKGDSDASSWLPPNKAFRCTYVSMQIFVKDRHKLWVTPAEHEAMQNVLSSCQDEDIAFPE